uniref:hypothetical protein n=1 Tax=uncultured Parabacteroides sp. TaxID=512312 RepID=UPI0028049FDA
ARHVRDVEVGSSSLLIPTTDEVNQIMVYLFFLSFLKLFHIIPPNKKYCHCSGKKVHIGWQAFANAMAKGFT